MVGSVCVAFQSVSPWVAASTTGARRSRPLETHMTFTDFDDLRNPFLAGTGPAYGSVAGLNQTQRSAVAHRPAAGLPVSADGTITLRARAWAVRGTVGTELP